MKKVFFLILVFSASLTAWSQTTSKLLATRTDNYNTASSSWAYSDSVLYEYDAQARDTDILSYSYSQNTWKLYYRAVIDYDANNNVLDLYYQLRDTNTNAYHNFFYKFSMTYNSVGDTISFLYQKWDSASNNWLNVSRLYRYPDANHRDTALIQQTWSSGWKNGTYSQIQYNANGQITSRLLKQWVTNAYVPQNQYLYSYNASNQRTRQVTQTWNSVTSAWENTSQFIYTWNSSGDNTQRQYQTWSTMPIGWTNDSLIYQSFSGTHKIVNQTVQIYNSSTSVYVNLAQYNYTYDANDNLLTNEYFSWANSVWNKQERHTYQYDANNNKTYEIDEYYDNSISLYTPNKRTYYYYKQFTTGITETPTYDQLSFYPNPVKGSEANIRFENTDGEDVTISIYDLQGRMISTEKHNAASGMNELKLDVSDLSSGSYLVRISNDKTNRTSTIKMLKG